MHVFVGIRSLDENGSIFENAKLGSVRRFDFDGLRDRPASADFFVPALFPITLPFVQLGIWPVELGLLLRNVLLQPCQAHLLFGGWNFDEWIGIRFVPVH